MDQVTEGWKKLACQLSSFAIVNKVDLSDVSELLSEKIFQYAKQNSLKGIPEIVDIFHAINGHDDCRIKIECDKRHCIECYYHFTCQKGLDPNNIYCTCNKQINPKIKNRFLNEYKRIQEMKVGCIVCNRKQDKMNFGVLNRHDCKICTGCIKEEFVYKRGEKNKCRVCNTQYDEECEAILKDLKELDETEQSKSDFYREKCFICEVEKDSRHYVEICQSRHLSCKDCIEKKRNNNENTCSCGCEISIIDNNR